MAIVFAKRCTECSELLPLSSYYRDARGYCGRQAICKPCWQVKWLKPHNQRHVEDDLYELDPEADLTW